jgi:hypothetical protein
MCPCCLLLATCCSLLLLLAACCLLLETVDMLFEGRLCLLHNPSAILQLRTLRSHVPREADVCVTRVKVMLCTRDVTRVKDMLAQGMGRRGKQRGGCGGTEACTCAAGAYMCSNCSAAAGKQGGFIAHLWGEGGGGACHARNLCNSAVALV